MKRYLVKEGPFSLSSGKVELTDEQYEPRANALRRVAEGRYEVLSKVEFKRAEVLGIEGEVSKLFLQALDVEEDSSSSIIPSGQGSDNINSLDVPLDGLSDEELASLAEECEIVDAEHMSRDELILAIEAVEAGEE